MIKKFRNTVKRLGITLRHWHRKNITVTSYTYFIMQLNDENLMNDEVKKAIEKYLDEV